MLAPWLLLALLAVGPAQSAALEDGFRDPPHDVRPGVYWFFKYSQASPECITRDLEAMKAVGLSGFLIYWGAPWQNTFPESVPLWRDQLRWALHEAARLELDGVISIGGGGCTSRYTKPELARKELVFSQARVRGPGRAEPIVPKKGALHTPKNADGSPQFYGDIALLAWPDQKDPVPLSVVRDISTALDPPSGQVRWEAPAGAWRIVRVGYAPNLFDSGGGKIDHLSREALEEHFQATLGPLLEALAPDERRALKGVECDSWEAGRMTWTPSLPQEFAQRRGYALRPWLAALAGAVLESAEDTERFRRDFQETISELIAENHYAAHRDLARRHGLISICEAAGPHQHQADVLRTSGRCDVSMGEFWMPSACRSTIAQRFMLRDAATAAHVYGMREVWCEAFTTVGTYWTESPAMLKPCADRAFCDGLNRVWYHNMMLSPSLTDKPGTVWRAGIHYNPQVTWWPQSAALNLYLSRCSWMLQQGRFAADALLYHGDGIDVHAGLKTPGDGLGQGYDYDFINSEQLQRLSVRDGLLLLPSGAPYRVLMLSERGSGNQDMESGGTRSTQAVQHPLSLAALQKIAELVRDGATLAGQRPPGPCGLRDDPRAFEALADELWGAPASPADAPRTVRRGRVIPALAQARGLLEHDGLGPDFHCTGASPADAVDWIHRTAGETEIYLLANLESVPQRVTCTFRVTGRKPELWDAVTGRIRPLAAFTAARGATQVPLTLPECGSCFVVFRQPGTAAGDRRPKDNKPVCKRLQELAGPWRVAFDPAWGGPESVLFDELQDWTQRPEEGIRYYSGTAVYHQTFDWDPAALEPGQRLELDLGAVQVVAEVRLNGRLLATLWTPPWRVDLTPALTAGKNQLEISVANLWPNRLIGDARLPKDQRLAKTNYTGYTATAPLLPSGLLGPVRLQIVQPASTE